MSEDGYFGMGKLSFGGLGKVIVSAVETQMAVSGSPVAGTGNVTPAQNGTPPPAMGAATARRPPRSIQTRQNPLSTPPAGPMVKDKDIPSGTSSPGGLAVASNLVKMVKGYRGKGADPTALKEELSAQLECMRLQAPAYHSGIAVVVDSSSLSPVLNNNDFNYVWYRQYKQGSRAIRIPDTDLTCGWYPPSADDIGMIMCVKCQDAHNLGLVKVQFAKVDRADPRLISMVEDAIEMNRLFVKKSVVTVCTLRGQPSLTDPSEVEGHGARPRGAPRASIGSMDEYDDTQDIDVPASCEVTLDGLLISERGGGTDSGLLITPSRRLKVTCLHPTSLVITVPLQIGSHINPAETVDGSPPQLQKQPSIRWLGKEQGDLFEHTSTTIQEHHTCFERYLRKQRRDQERRAEAAAQGPPEGDFTVTTGGMTKLTPPRSKTNTRSSTPEGSRLADSSPGFALPGQRIPVGVAGVVEEEGQFEGSATSGSAFTHAGAELADCDIDMSDAIAMDAEEGPPLSHEALHALPHSEMEQRLYKEVSLSLSSHGSSHGGSMSGDDDNDPSSEERYLPKQLSVRILCQDRTTRDALVLCIRTLVSETASLPTLAPTPSSSPTVLLTEEQRKSFLPWRQMQELNEATVEVNLPIMHNSASSASLDNAAGDNDGSAQLIESISLLEDRLAVLKKQRYDTYGIADEKQNQQALQLKHLMDAGETQRQELVALRQELETSKRLVADRDAAISKLKDTLEEENAKFMRDISELQSEFTNLETTAAQKEQEMMIESDRKIAEVAATEQAKVKSYRGTIDTLSAELDAAKTELVELQTQMEQLSKTDIESEISKSKSADVPVPVPETLKESVTTSTPATVPALASLRKGEDGRLEVELSSDTTVDIPAVERDVLQVLLDRWNAVVSQPPVSADVSATASEITTGPAGSAQATICHSIATVLSQHDLRIAARLSGASTNSTVNSVADTGGEVPDIGCMLDSIIFAEERPVDKTSSFDPDDDVVSQGESVDPSRGFRPSSRPASRALSASGDSHGHSVERPSERSRSNVSEDNIFLEMSCVLNGMLPPSEETVTTEDTLRKYHQSMLSKAVSRSASRDSTPHRVSPRLVGSPPPRLPPGTSSPNLGPAAMPSPDTRFTPTSVKSTPSRDADTVGQGGSAGSPGIVFPVSSILPPAQHVYSNTHEELLDLRLRVADLATELSHTEEGRRSAAEKWPVLVKTYESMKSDKESYLAQLKKANERFGKLSSDNESLLVELKTARTETERISGLLHTKTQALKDVDKIHSEEVLKICKENQELSVQYHTLLREHEEACAAYGQKVKRLNEELVIAEASSIDLSSQCGTDVKRIEEANLTIDAMQKELSARECSLSEVTAKVKSLETEVARSQKEATGLKRECTRLKETIATVQRNSEPVVKLRQDIAQLEKKLAESELKSNSLEQTVSTASGSWGTEKKDLECQLQSALERVGECEMRIVELENELLLSSDNRQALTRQKSTTDEMANQVKMLRQRLLEADQEAHAMQELLTAKQDENTKLSSDKELLEKEVETLRNTLEKRKMRIEKLKVEAADCKKLNEQSLQFDEERTRLKGIIDSLDKDRTELYSLRPQMAKLEATNADIKYQRDLLNNQTKRQSDELSSNALSIHTLEGHIHNYESIHLMLRQDLESMSMRAEELSAQTILLSEKYLAQQGANDKLKEDLHLAYTADPIRVKTLNFMLAKLQGDKNHWENKAKSLSRDLHRKLLAGTPLQRELGRVSARLEEVEHERNAYKDAMVLACDSFVPQPQPSWYDYIS